MHGFWDQKNIANYLRTTIPRAQPELTFCFYYGPNESGPLQAATDSTKEAWLMSIAARGECEIQTFLITNAFS